MFLIVGLGNPGIQYDNTRHNVGFMAVDEISSRHNLIFNAKSKYKADIATGSIKHHNVILCKPMTYMNLSGESVQQIAKFYKIDPANIIVMHDEIDLSIAKIKHKIGGGHAGHNGLRSIESCVGNKNFQRIRIGVGRPRDPRFEVSDYVLGKFNTLEINAISPKLQSIAEHIELLLENQLEEFKKLIS